jgi:TonB family protein
MAVSYRFSFSLSLALHLLAFWLLFFISAQKAIDMQKKPIWIEIDTTQDRNFRKQIVQTAPGQQVKEAKPDAFLGEKNQVVEKESVGKKFVESTAQQPRSRTAKADRSAKVQLKELGIPILPMAKQAMPQAEDSEQPHWAEQGNVAQDYVKGVKESERTLLNTKEYVFFGYFQRIRERLDRAWVPILRQRLLKLYRKGRHLASDTDHSTRVLVVLNSEGEVTHVKVINESGTSDLDDAAVSAFNEAGPFPNPPRGIINPNGEVEIPWEFILKT